MKLLTYFFVALLFLGANPLLANTVFDQPDLSWRYSDSLNEKNARNDSLLPSFDGEETLKELFKQVPDLLSLGDLPQGFEILTKLQAEIVFIDGIREESFCIVESPKSEGLVSEEWNLKMGVDFISGGSNTVIDHVKLCLQKAKEELGLAVKDDKGEIVFIPSGAQEDNLELYRVNATLDKGIQLKVLQTTQQVEETKECPTDIDSYLMLLDVYKQSKNSPADILQIQQELEGKDTGRLPIKSCAYSREWNQRYSEAYEISCDVNDEVCDVWQSQDGSKTWKLSNNDKGIFRYSVSSFLGISFGPKGIHEGGSVLDLKLIPLSKKIYLESYLDVKGEPVSLGLLIIAD